MNPSFNFIFGKPAGDGAGRWVEGSVEQEGAGYSFVARLMVRYSPMLLQCHPVKLKAERPFAPEDFAAYLRLVTTGQFNTVTRTLGLYETSELDSSAASAIFEATNVWLDPWDHNSLLLLQDLASLGEQLQHLRNREKLSLAITMGPGFRWTPVTEAGSSAHESDAK